MDRLSTLEQSIVDILETIDGTMQPSDYTYYTSTGQIMIEDEVISNAVSRSLGEFAYIDYTIEQVDVETNIEYEDSHGQNLYTNTVMYIITARIKNKVNSPNPKRDIKVKCNEVLSDIKYLFGQYNTLNGQATSFVYAESERQYNATHDIIRTADLKLFFELTYSQALNNPDIPTC